MQLPAGRIVEYKYVVLSADGRHATAWQGGNNSVLAVQAGEKAVEVFDNWCAHPLAVLRRQELIERGSECQAVGVGLDLGKLMERCVSGPVHTRLDISKGRSGGPGNAGRDGGPCDMPHWCSRPNKLHVVHWLHS